MLASGPAEVREAVDRSSTRSAVAPCGSASAGDGSRLKLAANAWVATVLEGIADSLALTRDLGLDPALFLEAVSGGAMDAPYVQLKGKAMLAGEYDPAFALAGALKDVDLILAAAAERRGPSSARCRASATTSPAPSTPGTETSTWPRRTSSTRPCGTLVRVLPE